MTVLASPIVADSSYTTAVFGIVGVLIGAVIAGGVGLWTAKQAREAAERAWVRDNQAAERAWVRDNRRAIYDRFLTCAQTLLIACEDARKPETEGAEASVKSADIKFWEAYSVVLTVADSALADAARIYAYRLWELRDSLRSESVMGSENFDCVTPRIRDGRHDTIDAMRAELGLEKTIWPGPDYNPFDGTNLQGMYDKGLKKRQRPGAVGLPVSVPSFKSSSSYPIKVEVPGLLHQVYVGARPSSSDRGQVVASTALSDVWAEARTRALAAEQVASPLAGRPYDLRHAAVSLSLNAGSPPRRCPARRA